MNLSLKTVALFSVVVAAYAPTFLLAGETLTVGGFSTASASIAVALNWTEDI